MQIVVNIDEYTYKDIKKGKIYSSIRDVPQESVLAIANGTPLPKGHGRLIDYGYVVDAIDDWVNAEEYRYTNATDYLRNRIRNVPTIIEAESEE